MLHKRLYGQKLDPSAALVYLKKTQTQIIHRGNRKATAYQHAKTSTDKEGLKHWAVYPQESLQDKLDTLRETIKGTNETKGLHTITGNSKYNIKVQTNGEHVSQCLALS